MFLQKLSSLVSLPLQEDGVLLFFSADIWEGGERCHSGVKLRREGDCPTSRLPHTKASFIFCSSKQSVSGELTWKTLSTALQTLPPLSIPLDLPPPISAPSFPK